MSYLLATCFLSEFQKPIPRPSVVAWLRAQEEDTLFLSVLTLGELQRGIARLPASRKRSRLEAWLSSDLRRRFDGRILPIDETVALRWGEVQASVEAEGAALPVMDSLIACTALVHDLAVVTRNGEDFARTGVAIADPWAAP
ncbi:MAG TPA: type II toxin-antitoxin system VapC family toxin [Thermoanaerobaculia bacterium]|nr:type II toxin-antitoxin system VapC family toxin [Thermoanaerobaculia bacterium]